MDTGITSALENRAPETSTPQSSNTWEPQTTHAADDYTPTTDSDSPTDNLPVANGHANGHANPPRISFPPRTSSLTHSRSNSTALTTSHTAQSTPTFTISPPPDPQRAPFALALRASLLSLCLGISLSLLIYLTLIHPSPLWRLPFFSYLLSQFHLLEYHITVLYNPDAATTSAFLLDNGRAYTIAHLCAFAECFLHWAFYPPSTLTPPPSPNPTHPVPTPLPIPSETPQQTYYFLSTILHSLTQPLSSPLYITLGLALLILGQILRSLAMARAGTNFTHLVASHKRAGHVLVTDGVYKYLRHPSYCGFFWWGVGGQMVLGNTWCLLGYAVVLWRFFRARIEKEEGFLVGFFANEYVRYRERTRVGIPFIG